MAINFLNERNEVDMLAVSVWAGAIKNIAGLHTYLRDKLKYDDIAIVGSVYSNPNDAHEDVDVLLLVDDLWASQRHLQNNHSAVVGGSAAGEEDKPEANWTSLRMGRLNVLLTDDEDHFEKFKLAAEVCRAIYPSKNQRIAIHKIIRDGAKADDVRPKF